MNNQQQLCSQTLTKQLQAIGRLYNNTNKRIKSQSKIKKIKAEIHQQQQQEKKKSIFGNNCYCYLLNLTSFAIKSNSVN